MNWCLKYCSAKRLGFPRGEAVMRSMTDEDRRNLFSSHAVRKKAACLDFFHTICVHMATKLSPFLIRPYGAPSPRGKVFSQALRLSNTNLPHSITVPMCILEKRTQFPSMNAPEQFSPGSPDPRGRNQRQLFHQAAPTAGRCAPASAVSHPQCKH